MCRAVTCKTCGKTTWAGCGQHVNEVMAGVSSAQRCPGHPGHPGDRSASDRSASGGSRLSRLFRQR